MYWILQKCAWSLPLLPSLLAGLDWSAGWRGRAPPLLPGGVGLALLAIRRTGRLIRQTPCRAGSEGWRMRERAAEWEDGTVAHTRKGEALRGERSGRRGGGGDMLGWRGRRPGFLQTYCESYSFILYLFQLFLKDGLCNFCSIQGYRVQPTFLMVRLKKIWGRQNNCWIVQ